MTSAGKHCWHCGKKLVLPHFAELADPLGHVHRVHKACLKDAEKSVRKITADIKAAARDLENIAR